MSEMFGGSRSRRGHAVTAEVCPIESPRVTELHINIRPAEPMTKAEAAGAVYGVAAQVLRWHQAHVFSERIFAIPGAVPAITRARNKLLDDLDARVPATILSVPVPTGCSVAGLQIHAIQSDSAPEPISFEGATIGRRFEHAGRTWVHLAGLTSPQAGASAEQARTIYERAGDVLRSQEMDFRCVARTWVWLRDILAWYDEFNSARTAVFESEGLVDTDGRPRYLPASTGISVAPADRCACALELIAISDGDHSIRPLQSGGEQNSAFSYGSAFARAVVAPMPAGPTLFVSGTAAIDPRGVSEHPGDVPRQIEATLQHIRAVLGEAGWDEDRIVSAIAYSKTPDVARAFAEGWSDLAWPRVETIADVCRDELLFEAEVTAAGLRPSTGAVG